MNEMKNEHRVTFVCRSGREAERRLGTRLERLQQEGLAVQVIAGDDEGLRRLAAKGGATTRIPVTGASNPAGWGATHVIIQGALLESRPLLVHAWGHRLGVSAVEAARRAGVPATVVTMEYHWLEEDPLVLPVGPRLRRGMPLLGKAERGLNKVVSPSFCRGMQGMYRRLAQEVSRYVVSTEFDRRLLLDLEVVDAEKLVLAEGGEGVVRAGPTEPDEAERVRDALGCPNHWRRFVGVVGPISRRHGSETLLWMIRKMRKAFPSLGWIVVPREDSQRAEVRALKRWEKRGWVKVVEEETAVVDPFRALEILVWVGSPSTPVDPILEAARVSVPTVGYETPAARAVVDPAPGQALVLEGDRGRLMAQLTGMLRDSDRRGRAGRSALEESRARFGREEIDERFLQLYDEVLREELTQ